MKFEIKHRWSGSIIFTAEIEATEETSLNLKLGLAIKKAVEASANLRSADLRSADLYGADLSSADLSSADLRSADLSSADLSGADLYGADLSSADLRSADLYGADLRCADLRSADLSSADLRSADLYGADLRSARGIIAERSTLLLMLLDQPGKIRAYKLVNADGFGPIKGGLKYEIGQPVAVENANIDVTEHCGAGINVATLDWCLREWRSGYKILIVEFEAKDIAAIPTATDGKFRLHRCDVIAEKIIDPVALGLMKAPEEEAA